jgi:hypothetical protein
MKNTDSEGTREMVGPAGSTREGAFSDGLELDAEESRWALLEDCDWAAAGEGLMLRHRRAMNAAIDSLHSGMK